MGVNAGELVFSLEGTMYVVKWHAKHLREERVIATIHNRMLADDQEYATWREDIVKRYKRSITEALGLPPDAMVSTVRVETKMN